MYRNYYTQNRNCCSCNNMCKNGDNKEIIDDSYEDIQNANDLCKCGFDEEDNQFPQNPMFAQSYIPWQKMDKTFVHSVGLKMGTIFPELVSPYMSGDSIKQIEYLKNTNTIGEGCNQ